jgi:hypothetical protein
LKQIWLIKSALGWTKFRPLPFLYKCCGVRRPMVQERANTEALVVLLLEMFVFLGFCLGLQAAFRAPDEQPALVSTVVVALVLCSAFMSVAAVVNELFEEWKASRAVVFVIVRAAWHFALAITSNCKVFAAMVVTADDTQHRNWSLLLLQTQTRKMENLFFTAVQNGWILSVISVVLLMQMVFYSKALRGLADEGNYAVGRFTTMFACCALLVQFTTESELGRACTVRVDGQDVRPVDIASCELQQVPDRLPVDYSLLLPVAAALSLLLFSDILLCVLHAKLLRPAHTQHTENYTKTHFLKLVYCFVALLPCAAFFVTVFVALHYTTPTHLAYLVVVGAMLTVSCVRRVWTALAWGTSNQVHPEDFDVAQVVQPVNEMETVAYPLVLDMSRSAIMRGTSQIGKREKKRQ